MELWWGKQGFCSLTLNHTMMALDFDELKGELDQFMVAMWTLHVYRQFSTEYQLLGHNSRAFAFSLCLWASWKQLLGAVGVKMLE